jgi:UDP-glucose:(heptosyl)LPS alpha-1,3-glucosyltransferase
MKGKIAIIIERANVALGGAERSVSELAAALSKLGVQADILAAKGRPNSRNIHVLCRNMGGKRVGYSTLARAAERYLSQNKYDVIHSVLPFGFADVYQPRGGTYAESILRNTASYRNENIRLYKRLTAFMNLRRSAFLRAERRLARGADGPVIAALSQYVAEQFKGHYGTDSRRIIVIPNGVRIDRQVNADQAGRLRRQILAEAHLKEADEPVLFLFAANNFRLKGLAPLIGAISRLANRGTGHKCCLVVAGKGRPRKYRRLARRLGLPTPDWRIVFLGPVSHIQSVLSISDVAVLPSFYDPSSRFVLEALAAGKPVITTKFNGAIDLFVDNRHGKVIDTPENINALAEAIRYFTDKKNIENASRAIIEDNLKENISIDRAARQLADVYESILQRKGRQ